MIIGMGKEREEERGLSGCVEEERGV